MSINYVELEDWGLRAAQAIQEIVDDCEEACAGENCCSDLKGLLDEHSRIQRGEPSWQARLLSQQSDVELKL